MANIVLANTKGGSCKTTSALLLGSAIYEAGGKVVFIEGDKNRPLTDWASKRDDCAVIDASRIDYADDHITRDEALAALTAAAGERTCVVVLVLDENTLLEWIAAASQWGDACICDPEGSPNDWMTRAVSQAHAVLIPFAPTALDAKQVVKTVKSVRDFMEMTRQKIPYAALIGRANAFQTRDEKVIREMLDKAKVPILPVSLKERPAYRAIFGGHKLLSELDPAKVNGVEKAQNEAKAYAQAVIDLVDSAAKQEAA